MPRHSPNLLVPPLGLILFSLFRAPNSLRLLAVMEAAWRLEGLWGASAWPPGWSILRIFVGVLQLLSCGLAQHHMGRICELVTQRNRRVLRPGGASLELMAFQVMLGLRVLICF